MSGKKKQYKRSHIRDRKRSRTPRGKDRDATTTVEFELNQDTLDAMRSAITSKRSSVRVVRNGETEVP